MMYLWSFQNVLHNNTNFELFHPFSHKPSSFPQEIIQKARKQTLSHHRTESFLQQEENEIKHVL
jgi:hypothetical protein